MDEGHLDHAGEPVRSDRGIFDLLVVGVQQPHASWGNIIQDGSDQIATAWWISFFPGMAIVLTVMAFNAIGDALRHALDPRSDAV